jgi:hypothetical protein
MTHFLNLICATFLFYAAVTRGGLGVARVLELAFARDRG